jgi:hypothetical protein
LPGCPRDITRMTSKFCWKKSKFPYLCHPENLRVLRRHRALSYPSDRRLDW